MLRLRWGKKQKDWMIDYSSSPDGWLMHSFLKGDMDMPEMLKELEERGYDLSTLRFVVKKKEVTP